MLPSVCDGAASQTIAVLRLLLLFAPAAVHGSVWVCAGGRQFGGSGGL